MLLQAVGKDLYPCLLYLLDPPWFLGSCFIRFQRWQSLPGSFPLCTALSLTLLSPSAMFKDPCGYTWTSQVALVKEPTCQCRRHKRHGFDPCVGKIHWRRAWQPTPIFLSGKSHGQEHHGIQSIMLQRVRHNWINLACTHKRTWIYTQLGSARLDQDILPLLKLAASWTPALHVM